MRSTSRHHCYRSRFSQGPRPRHGKRRISFPSQTSTRPHSSRCHFCRDLVRRTGNKHHDMNSFSDLRSVPKSVSGSENPRPFTAVKARGAHGALRASHLPLGEFLVQDRGAFPTDFFFTSGLSTTILRPSILDTRVLEPHRQSVRFSHQPSPRASEAGLRLAGTGRISFASCLAVVEAFVSNAWLTMIRCLLAVRSLCQAPTQITLFTFPPGHQRAASAVELALGGDALPQKSPNRCVGRPPQGAGNNISLPGTTAHTAWACPLA